MAMEPGNRVKVIAGAYRGFEGELLSLAGDGQTAYLRLNLGSRAAIYAARVQDLIRRER
jgi:transcription antitermination factor NusG